VSRLVLDAGAFVAFERGDARVVARLAAARKLGFELVTTSPVVGQVWRNGRRQALVARLLAATRVDAPNEQAARRAGELLAATRTTDVVDALIAVQVADGDTILTSDPGDLAKLVSAAGVRATIATV
jgi:predicted nucleic acid-binding protein